MMQKRLFNVIRLLLVSAILSGGGISLATEPVNHPKRTVKIATLANFPPQYSLDDDGNPTGFAVDVMNQVAELAHLTPVYIVFPNWPEAQQALQSGVVDIIPNMGITKRRREFADFTAPVETFPVSIFVRQTESGIHSVQDLSGHKVAVVKVNVGCTLLKDRADIELVLAGNPSEATMFLLSGQADALVFPQPVIKRLARKSGIENKLKVVGEPLKEIVRGIGVRKGQSDLRDRLDAAVRRFVATEAYQFIYIRWHGEPRSYWTGKRLLTASGVILAVLTVGMFIMRCITLTRFNKKLEKNVQNRTAELNDVTCKLKQAQELARSGWWEYDVVNNKGIWQDTSYALFGINPVEAPLDYKSFLKFVHPEYHDYHNAQIHKILEEGLAEFQYPITRPDGETRWIWARGETEYDKKGNPVRLFGMMQDITERKHLEEEHRKNTERLLAIFNTAPVGIVHVEDRIVIEANSYISQLLGYKLTEIIGRPTRHFYVDDDEWRRVGQIMATGLKKQSIVSADTRVRHKDGHIKHVLMTCTKISDKPPLALLTTLQNITSRKEMEEALKASEKRFRALIEASTQIVWGCDPKGYVNEDSPSWRAYTGQTYEQWSGYGYLDAIHPKDREAAMERWQEGLKQGCPVTNEFRLHHHSGRWRWCQARAVPIMDDTGQINSWVGMNTDIHDQREAEIALRESEKKFHQAMYHAPIGQAIVSITGQWVEVNPALCRIVGYTKEELLATNPLSITHPDDLDTDLENYRRMLDGEHPMTYQTEKRYIHKNGHAVWIQINAALVRDEQEDPQYFIAQIQDITVRIQNEQKLREGQSRFEAIIDASPIPLALTDNHENVTYLNPAFVNTLGYTREDIPTLEKWWPLAYPDASYREKIKQKWWQLIQQTEEQQTLFVPLEINVRCKDGSNLTMLATSTLLKGFAEKIRLVTLYDITLNKIISERLKTLLATASDGIHVLDEQGNIVEFSDSFARMLGYTVEEAAQLNVADWEAQIPPDNLTSIIKDLFKSSRTFETRHRRKDGSIFNAEINAKAIILDGRQLLYGSSRDITERKNAERSLRYYEKIASSVDLLLSLMDRNEVFLQVNDTLAKTLGASRDEIIGKTVKKIVDTENYLKMKLQIEQSLAGEVVCGEMWLDFPCRGKRLYNITRYPMFDEDGRVYAVAGVGYDMTDIMKANEKLKQANESLRSAKQAAESANKTKSIFLSNMTHELRTPLNAILGYTQIFKADKTLDSHQQSGIRTIHQAGEHLLMIINDVLDMSKIEAGKLQLVPSDIQLLPFFQNIMDFFTCRAREKGLTISFETGSSLPAAIISDELRLRQVIFNLLSNAIKFTARGYCRLHVEAADREKNRCQLKISVEDSGVGIPEDQQDEIFAPFKQVGERLQYKEGTGLGLAISKQLVNLMGGRMTLTSPVTSSPAHGTGAGSRFTFTIETEIVQGEKTLPPKDTKEIVGYNHTGETDAPIKILIVDDKTSNRAVLHDTLKPLGFTIEEAEDGTRVSEICIRNRPDLILMDLRMPNVDGFTAMNQLKQHDALRDIPVVAVTASIAEISEFEKRCLQHGFKGLILKPFVASELLETIAGLLPIELVYQEKNEPESDDFSEMEIPPDDEIAKLSESLSKGDIANILEHAKIIGQLEEGRYLKFSKLICTLAEDFKFSELEKYILSEEKSDE